MAKRLIWSTILTLCLILTACQSSQNLNETNNNGNNKSVDIKESTDTQAKITKLATIYSLALDSLMPIDEGLNGDMKYIAINTKTLKDASDEDKKYILKYFEKYKVPVMDESFKTLKDKGMVKEGNYIEGMLLSLSNIEFTSDKEVVIEGEKFRSGLGAIGVKIIVKYKDGSWKVEKADMIWIS